ncbi:small nuclear ribonucleoprotein SmD3b-like [Chenopodium quinoa]|uniref:small nuclear ribonucleoprotein SmD3b-like n=1 Tax=Chenopodium quinoa TaxID=63459 RepID=UPI000B78C471|nr:small nuclear ribonucleoprotein SmD3b-like [Chenopodium quinoa]
MTVLVVPWNEVYCDWYFTLGQHSRRLRGNLEVFKNGRVIQSGSILVVQFPSLVLGVVGRAGGIALSGVRDGKISQLEHVFIRGRRVRFMITPDMLKNAPMFKRLDARIKCKRTSLGVGCGRAVAMRAKAQATGRGTAGRGVVPPVRR